MKAFPDAPAKIIIDNTTKTAMARLLDGGVERELSSAFVEAFIFVELGILPA